MPRTTKYTHLLYFARGPGIFQLLHFIIIIIIIIVGDMRDASNTPYRGGGHRAIHVRRSAGRRIQFQAHSCPASTAMTMVKKAPGPRGGNCARLLFIH
jgi:hypothetical protein